MKKNLKYYIYFLWTFSFTVIPLIFIIYFSFKVKNEKFIFTIENYKKFFDLTYIKVFFISFKLSILSTLWCLILGFPAAYALSTINCEKRRNILALFFIIPLWTNFLLRTYSWMSIFREQGIINHFLQYFLIIDKPIKFLYNDAAIVIGMIYNFLPFMVLPIYTSLINIDNSYIDAAKDLGAKNKDLFFRILIPLSLPSIISGSIMVFMPSLSTFIVSDLLGGSQKMMIGNLIQREFLAARNWETGSSISVIMILVIFLILIVLKKITKEDKLNEGFKVW